MEKKDTQWSCTLCTFNNKASRNACEMCGTRRKVESTILPTPTNNNSAIAFPTTTIDWDKKLSS